MRAGDFGGHFATLGGGNGGESADHRGQGPHAAVLRQDAEEVAGESGNAEVRGQTGNDVAHLSAADLRIADQCAQVGRFGQRTAQLVEVTLDSRDGARLAREIDQGGGITPCQTCLDTGGKLHAYGSLVRLPKTIDFACRWMDPTSGSGPGWRAPSIG